jgi:hypothetical protein
MTSIRPAAVAHVVAAVVDLAKLELEVIVKAH